MSGRNTNLTLVTITKKICDTRNPSTNNSFFQTFNIPCNIIRIKNIPNNSARFVFKIRNSKKSVKI